MKCIAAKAPVRAVARTLAPATKVAVRPVVRMNVGIKMGSNPAFKYQQRSDYKYYDVDDYFNCGGFLAAETNYDRMEALLKDREPVDVMLILAAENNDPDQVRCYSAAGSSVCMNLPPLQLPCRVPGRSMMHTTQRRADQGAPERWRQQEHQGPQRQDPQGAGQEQGLHCPAVLSGSRAEFSSGCR